MRLAPDPIAMMACLAAEAGYSIPVVSNGTALWQRRNRGNGTVELQLPASLHILYTVDSSSKAYCLLLHCHVAPMATESLLHRTSGTIPHQRSAGRVYFIGIIAPCNLMHWECGTA
jgi:hypothetical protein